MPVAGGSRKAVSDAVADADPFTDDEAVIKLEVPSSIGQGGCETFNSKDRRWNFTFYGDRMGACCIRGGLVFVTFPGKWVKVLQ
jgi:hypothetical protein